MTIDGIGSYCALDPFEGAKIVVAESARNIACSGAEPVGMTDCLNFGSPEKPEVFYYFDRVIAGLGEACRALDIPITGGNVSLYNENPTGAIDPTPIVGMMGLFQDVTQSVTQWFKQEGNVIYLLGEIGDSIGGSRYLQLSQGLKTGLCPRLDLSKEKSLHQTLIEGARKGLWQSAHDCSDGGFAVALAECCFTGLTHEKESRGARVFLPGKGRLDGRLFGEAQSRVIVSCEPQKAAELESLARAHDVPFDKIGVVEGEDLEISGVLQAPVSRLGELFFTAIEKKMG
jgi:phosphoribosylformylglycinamidine synthase